jgi:hypothetical protein
MLNKELSSGPQSFRLNEKFGDSPKLQVDYLTCDKPKIKAATCCHQNHPQLVLVSLQLVSLQPESQVLQFHHWLLVQ